MILQEKKHIEKIDILRGIAILTVFVYHCQDSLFPNYTVTKYNNGNLIDITTTKSGILNFSPTAFGWSGVQLFLLISGFLIHLAFLSNNSRISIGTFYSKRFWRICPPYALVLLFFCFSRNAAWYYFFTKDGLLDFFSHLFLFNNLSDKYFFTINPSFWSLALEMQLYLIYPLLLMIRKKIGIKNTFILTIFISILLFAFSLFSEQLNKSVAYNTSVLKFWFIWCAGAFLAENYFNGKKVFFKRNFLLFIVMLILTILSKIHLYSSCFTLYLATFTWFVFFEWILKTEFVNPKKYLFKFISIIGICSYSIYLIHQPFLKDLLNYFNIYKNLKLFKLIPVFLVIFLISYSIYLFIELPSIKIGAYFRKRRQSNI